MLQFILVLAMTILSFIAYFMLRRMRKNGFKADQ